jgi:hypothetical protein
MADCNHCADEALFRFLTLLSHTPPFCHARDGKELGDLMRHFVSVFDLMRHRSPMKPYMVSRLLQLAQYGSEHPMVRV